VHAQVLEATGTVTQLAAVRLGQAQALAELRADEGCELVLTVPSLRGTLIDLTRDSVVSSHPLETLHAMTRVSSTARERPIIAAPYVHPGLTARLTGHVERMTADGGQVVVITRSLSPGSPSRSASNQESIALFRAAARPAERGFMVCSREEDGIGIHFKTVVADRDLAPSGGLRTSAGPSGVSRMACKRTAGGHGLEPFGYPRRAPLERRGDVASGSSVDAGEDEGTCHSVGLDSVLYGQRSVLVGMITCMATYRVGHDSQLYWTCVRIGWANEY
jgi:hypothetical protein